MTTLLLSSGEAAARSSSTLAGTSETFLAQYKGQTRLHAESDLACFTRWCHDHDLEPLDARRADLELYLRWMQVTRRFQALHGVPAPVGCGQLLPHLCDRRVLEQSPADHVRRPRVAPESPTLGLSHLQFEAMLTAARYSSNVNDSALVCMLGLLGLRAGSWRPRRIVTAQSTETNEPSESPCCSLDKHQGAQRWRTESS